jgi:hypothetical protein
MIHTDQRLPHYKLFSNLRVGIKDTKGLTACTETSRTLTPDKPTAACTRRASADAFLCITSVNVVQYFV